MIVLDVQALAVHGESVRIDLEAVTRAIGGDQVSPNDLIGTRRTGVTSVGKEISTALRVGKLIFRDFGIDPAERRDIGIVGVSAGDLVITQNIALAVDPY